MGEALSELEEVTDALKGVKQDIVERDLAVADTESVELKEMAEERGDSFVRDGITQSREAAQRDALPWESDLEVSQRNSGGEGALDPLSDLFRAAVC